MFLTWAGNLTESRGIEARQLTTKRNSVGPLDQKVGSSSHNEGKTEKHYWSSNYILYPSNYCKYQLAKNIDYKHECKSTSISISIFFLIYQNLLHLLS